MGFLRRLQKDGCPRSSSEAPEGWLSPVVIPGRQLQQLPPHWLDRFIASAMAGGLLLEVGLIMAGIVWLTLRSFRLTRMDDSCAFALRGGLWLLTLSCGLGMMVTLLGELNLAAGKLPEVWAPAGVLKYPHGAALHAIQTLPILSWLLYKLRVSKPAWLVRAALWSQVFFLIHAFWQTIHGRARFDLDWVGGAIFVAAGLLILAPMAGLAAALFSFARAWRWRSS